MWWSSEAIGNQNEEHLLANFKVLSTIGLHDLCTQGVQVLLLGKRGEAGSTKEMLQLPWLNGFDLEAHEKQTPDQRCKIGGATDAMGPGR